MVDWVCGGLGGSLIPQLHLTTLLRRLWLQTKLYCADSGSKRSSTAQTLAPNEALLLRLVLQITWFTQDSSSHTEMYLLHFSIVEGSGETRRPSFFTVYDQGYEDRSLYIEILPSDTFHNQHNTFLISWHTRKKLQPLTMTEDSTEEWYIPTEASNNIFSFTRIN